jgi:hypothetical protein
MTASQKILATIGAKVCFFPSTSGDAQIKPFQVGTIVHLWSEACANIEFDMPNGTKVNRSSVPLFQADDGTRPYGYYAYLLPPADATDQAMEAEIVAKGLTAPRITPAEVERNIASVHYFTAAEGVDMADPEMTDALMPQPLKLLTFCVLILSNGFTVTGESACASPENFDAEVGRKIARANAVNKIWPLMGYELRSKLAAAAPVTVAQGLSPNAEQHYEGPDDFQG